VGKTQLARTLAHSLGGRFARVHRRLALVEPLGQGTPRMLLGDGQAPVVYIRAARAPAGVLSAHPPPLPAGVMAVASRGRASP
jgi:hypothetical protein